MLILGAKAPQTDKAFSFEEAPCGSTGFFTTVSSVFAKKPYKREQLYSYEGEVRLVSEDAPLY